MKTKEIKEMNKDERFNLMVRHFNHICEIMTTDLLTKERRDFYVHNWDNEFAIDYYEEIFFLKDCRQYLNLIKNTYYMRYGKKLSLSEIKVLLM